MVKQYPHNPYCSDKFINSSRLSCDTVYVWTLKRVDATFQFCLNQTSSRDFKRSVHLTFILPYLRSCWKWKSVQDNRNLFLRKKCLGKFPPPQKKRFQSRECFKWKMFGRKFTFGSLFVNSDHASLQFSSKIGGWFLPMKFLTQFREERETHQLENAEITLA